MAATAILSPTQQRSSGSWKQLWMGNYLLPVGRLATLVEDYHVSEIHFFFFCCSFAQEGAQTVLLACSSLQAVVDGMILWVKWRGAAWPSITQAGKYYPLDTWKQIFWAIFIHSGNSKSSNCPALLLPEANHDLIFGGCFMVWIDTRNKHYLDKPALLGLDTQPVNPVNSWNTPTYCHFCTRWQNCRAHTISYITTEFSFILLEELLFERLHWMSSLVSLSVFFIICGIVRTSVLQLKPQSNENEILFKPLEVNETNGSLLLCGSCYESSGKTISKKSYHHFLLRLHSPQFLLKPILQSQKLFDLLVISKHKYLECDCYSVSTLAINNSAAVLFC